MIDIYSSVVFGAMPLMRGRQANVLYPAEILDDGILLDNCYLLDGNGATTSDSLDVATPSSWLHPWNKIYRFLEFCVTLRYPIDSTQREILLQSVSGVKRDLQSKIGNQLSYTYYYITNLLVGILVIKSRPPAGDLSTLQNIINYLGGVPLSLLGTLSVPVLPIIGGIGSILAVELKSCFNISTWNTILKQI